MDLTNITILTFLGVIALAFLRLLFASDNNSQSFQKIIGGFSVFIVALIIEHLWVVVIALFIGGLVIASESFMKSLAAILKADSQHIKDIVYISEASSEEVKKKEEGEQKIVKSQVNSKKQTSVFQRNLDTERKIEEKVRAYFSQKFNLEYSSQVKVASKNGTIVLDGILRSTNDSGFLFTETPKPVAVEIKYIPDLKDKLDALNPYLDKIVENIRSNIEGMELLLVLVGDDLQHNDVPNIKQVLSRRHETLNHALFSYNPQENKIKELYTPQIIQQ